MGQVIRKRGISTQTFYGWKKQYGQMGVGEIRRLKQFEEENRNLKQMVADLSLDKLTLRMWSQKTLRPDRRWELVQDLEARYRVSERRGCRVLLFYRSSHRYEATRDDQAILRMRIREMAEARVRYGYYRIYILLLRDGRLPPRPSSSLQET